MTKRLIILGIFTLMMVIGAAVEVNKPVEVYEYEWDHIEWKQDASEPSILAKQFELVNATSNDEILPPKYTYISLGEFKVTAYCPCRECSGKWGTLSSTGEQLKEGHSVAVNPRVIPYGTHIYIGETEYVAVDCGGKVKGKHIDIYFEDHDTTVDFGVQQLEVFVKEKEDD